MRILLLLVLLGGASSAFAASFAFDLDLFYFSDSFTGSGSASTYTRTMYDLAPMIALTQKKDFLIGWNYDSMSYSDSPAGTATTLSVTDMGPKLDYFFNKERTWMAGFTYDLITKGNYTTAGSTYQVSGTALKLEFGYLGQMTESTLVGAKLNYYKASFSDSVVGSVLTKVTEGRTTIYPSFSLTFRWD